MKNVSSDIYVTHIGNNRINFRGSGSEKFAKLSNAEINKRKTTNAGKEEIITTVILFFSNEGEMIKFLQKIINQDIPFTDNSKSTAYQYACALKKMGKLKGKIFGC